MRFFTFLLILIAMSVGCSTTSSSGIRNQENPYQINAAKKNITYFGKWLNIVSVRTSSDGSEMAVNLDVQSVSLREKKIAYRVLWFDRSGSLIDTILSRWQDRLIKPSQILTLKGQAPTLAATDYRIEIMDK